jgi:exodeoxyribonuclease VIII
MNAIVTPTREPHVVGIRKDLGHNEYLSIEALSAHGCKRIVSSSPAHFRYDRDFWSEETTRALDRGTALHMAILEPERYPDEVISRPEDAPKKPTAAQWAAKKPSPSSVEAMKWWGEFNAQCEGKLVLRADDARSIAGMAAAVRKHPFFQAYMLDETAESEVSFQWTDARLNIPCKARFDYLRGDRIAVDVKSCADASPEGFARACAKYLYHLQAAWYNNAHEHLRNESLKAFIFLAVESEPPHGVAAYVLEANALTFGARRCEDAMLLYAQSLQTGYWRAYSDKVQLLSLPAWATRLTNPDFSRG